MIIGLIISVSIVIQFFSAFFSLRLIKTTGFRLSWLFISISMLFMGIRRVIGLFEFVLAPGASQPGYVFELAGLVTSCLMLSGVVMIGPLFRSIRQNEEKLKALSITDELTGLHNRRGLTAFAEHLMRKADRDKTGFYLLFADLDGMKEINDTLGHHEGDQALQVVADILKKTYRKSDTVARVGGDEFVVVPAGFEMEDVKNITMRLQQNIDDFNAFTYSKFKLSLSVGISYYDPEAPCSVDELISEADRLMYAQKKTKKNNGDAVAA